MKDTTQVDEYRSRVAPSVEKFGGRLTLELSVGLVAPFYDIDVADDLIRLA